MTNEPPNKPFAPSAALRTSLVLNIKSCGRVSFYSELLYMDSAIYKGCDYYNYEHNHGKLKQPIITHQNFRIAILFGSF